MRDPNAIGELEGLSGTAGPSVSVVVPTYQQAAYIEQCLDGILAQQTTFPFEVLIGEDESTDGTREICERYAAEHPDRIRLFLRSRKDVIYVVGRPTGRYNLKCLLASARGSYVAMCEGDDYWIDPLKLQKQVDILERDPGISLVFHNVWIKHEISRRDSFLNHGLIGDRFTAKDVFAREWFVGTASICARAAPLKDALADFDFAISADNVLQYHAALKGDFHYLDVVASVYRRHAGGISEVFWPTKGDASIAKRYNFEVLRPNHVWILHRIYLKVEDIDCQKAIALRIEVLLRRIALYRVQSTTNSLVTIPDLEAYMRKHVLAAAPKDIRAPYLVHGSMLGGILERTAVSVWAEQAEANLCAMAKSGYLLACVRLCAHMFRERSYSRAVLLLLALKSVGWWMAGQKNVD